ncbi:MAG: hypothetical protein M1818_005333 [Claussenomyces sp. TS43310]|nr:MAG: hypothetical protein M1818_005333 [Claussenomyces sp. TS43310]
MGAFLSAIATRSKFLQRRRQKKRADLTAHDNQKPRAPSSPRPNQSQSRRPPDSSPAPAGYALPGTGTDRAGPELGQQEPAELEAIAVGTSRAEGDHRAGSTKMASDEDYMSFLDQANRDPAAETGPTTSSSAKPQFKATDAGAEIPRELKVPTDKEEWIYVSDADEPFVAVSLKLHGAKLPDEETFAKLIEHPEASAADVAILDVADWDPRGQYKDVVDATRRACKGGDVRVYKVARGRVEVEYWVVGVEGGRLVGVKALAVES